MGKKGFQIDPRLLADSHELLIWQGCHIRLHNNASLPWVIIVPETTAVELHDLAIDEQLKILQLSQLIGDHLKQHKGITKINFAAIGNVVQQLHIHVIGRHPQDPLWPDVVWGKALPNNSYLAEDMVQFRNDLSQLLEVK